MIGNTIFTKKTKAANCPICFNLMECTALVDEDGKEHSVVSPPACGYCERRYPPSLIKASGDNFEYACKLTSGEIVYFSSCEISGDYVTLHDITPASKIGERSIPASWGEPKIIYVMPHEFPRGLDVRVDQIVWCADAPDGS